MLGGDDADDLDNIINECNNQPERVGLFRASAEASHMQAREEAVTTPQLSSTNNDSATVQALLAQNSKLMEALLSQNQTVEVKRKAQEEVSYSPQDPILLFEEAYRLEDDAHEKIDTHLRQKLRPINAPPESYYTKGAFRRVERPIPGETLYTEHIMPNQVNPAMKCKMHDRCAVHCGR